MYIDLKLDYAKLDKGIDTENSETLLLAVIF